MEQIQTKVDALVSGAELTAENVHALAGEFWKVGDLAEHPETEDSRTLFASLKALNNLFTEGKFEKKGGKVQREYRCLLAIIGRSNVLTPNQSRSVTDNLSAAIGGRTADKGSAGQLKDIQEIAAAFQKLQALGAGGSGGSGGAKKKSQRRRRPKGEGKAEKTEEKAE